MIPFAVKHAWFWLALTGTISCWITLIVLPRRRRIGGFWGRLIYCIIITWMEGAFCLGMIWHMDPSRMPRAFCIFQTLTFSFAAFGLSGWCASFSIATSLAVFRPSSFDGPSSALSWNARYIPTLIVYPVVASAAFAVVVFKLDAVKPVGVDDMHCDATDPFWVLLVGYGGVSPLFSVPFLILSIMSAFRIYKFVRKSEEPSVDSQQSIELQSTNGNNPHICFPAYVPYSKEVGPSSPASITSGFPRAKIGFNFVDAQMEKEAIPDSPCSTTMPVFASNPSLAVIGRNAPSRNSELNSVSNQVIGLALTTEDDNLATRGCTPSDMEIQVGVALTTDEPDLGDSHLEVPHTSNPLVNDVGVTSVNSDPDMSHLSPQQMALRGLTSYDPSVGVPQAPIVTFPQPFLPPTSSPFSSTIQTFSIQEERQLLPPRISPIRSESDHHVLELPTTRRSSSIRSETKSDFDLDLDFEDEDPYSPKILRIHTRRDPRERLGVYNPTPPTPIAMLQQDNIRHRQRQKTKRKIQTLMGALRRMVLFQIGFFVVQMLAALSIIINVAENRLMSFGTQHVALLLAAWGPFLIYAGAQLMAKLLPTSPPSPTTSQPAGKG